MSASTRAARTGSRTSSRSSSPADKAPRALVALHAAVERGDLDELDALLATSAQRLLPGELEAMEKERDRLFFRLKRCACESLAAVLRGGCADKIAKAIEVARRRGVDEADVTEAETALADVLELDEWGQVRAGGAAFEAVQRDDIAGLQSALAGGAWAAWRDELGRGLVEASRAHGAEHVEAFLLRDGGLDVARWKEAFRLVCRDNAEELAELLSDVSPLVWCEHMNAGGKTLLELAQERDKPTVYAWLAMSMGRLKELPPESIQVDDPCWVFEEKRIQPRAAKILSVDDGFAAVAFWDSATEERRVRLTHIRRMR